MKMEMAMEQAKIRMFMRILTTPDCSRQIRSLLQAIEGSEEKVAFLSQRKESGYWDGLSPTIRGLLEERLEMFKKIAAKSKTELDELQAHLMKTAEVWEGEVELPEDWMILGGWRKSRYLGG